MSRLRLIAGSLALAVATGCGGANYDIYRPMIATATSEFTKPMGKTDERIWIAPPGDFCDDGNQSGVAAGGASMFGGGPSGPSAFDSFAVEVMTDWLTKNRRGQVIERARANYMTGDKTKTRLWQTDKAHGGEDAGNDVTVGTFEDMCILDEAKKRSAEKVLTFRIMEIQAEEIKIHMRLSDVETGLVEISRSLQARRSAVRDLPAGGSGGGG